MFTVPLVLTALLLAHDRHLPLATNSTERASANAAPCANDVNDVRSHHEEKHPNLRRHASGGNDEARLAGANVLNAEKIKLAIADPEYAQKLFERWRRHDVTSEDASKTLTTASDAHDKLLQDYKTYLGKRDLRADYWITEKMVERAIKDPKGAVWLFKLLKLYQFHPEHLVEYKEALKLSKKKLLKLHAMYEDWYQLHHPQNGRGPTRSVNEFLFEKSRVKRALEDGVFAKKLFAKWRNAGFERDGALDEVKRYGIGKRDLARLGERYAEWLGEPPPRKSVFERFRRFLRRLYKALARKFS
ncbi:hypothetical protein PsorP6_006690 [Peronosclerospora sorghi]|uniref:Uncharacterized protein n=1 Tax=Peronosclerospora sorghi TaxID=230839 RepID=A0ACC0W1X5_9STRA|nr:hypothetical protein PsorP6_006690 [Peronosclerospora sorghi]